MRQLTLLLVHMPIASAVFPNLGIEKLAGILRAKGHRADVLYGSLQFFPAVPGWISQDSRAGLLFGKAYYGGATQEWVSQIEAQLSALVFTTIDAAERDFGVCIQSASDCIDKCIKWVGDTAYDAVGFSIGFDAQRLASAALARELKLMRPALKVLAGGTACDGVMGPATLKAFPEFDAVYSGEADGDIEEAFLSMLDPCISIPKTQSTRAEESERSGDVALVNAPELHDRPAADYGSFISQWTASEYGSTRRPLLLYEASRGCWYGKKNHCVFCGIRNVTESYRAISADQVLNDIRTLDQTYSPELIYLTDAIISRQAFKDVFPVIATWRRQKQFGARLFVETKSNLTPLEVAVLSDANVRCIQPGIESFITSTLTAMNKGATGMQQIELLKWCATFQVEVTYGLILGTPGESADDLWDTAQLCNLLHHLPAPSQAGELLLHRFSPHFKDPGKFGMTNIRPYRFQEVMYRVPREVLMDLCYGLNFDLSGPGPSADELASRNAVHQAVDEWNTAKNLKSRLIHAEHGDCGVVIRGDRFGVSVEHFEGVAAQILSRTHRATSIQRLSSQIPANLRPDIGAAIEYLEDKGILLRLDNRVLNLATPARGRAVAHRAASAQSRLTAIEIANG